MFYCERCFTLNRRIKLGLDVTRQTVNVIEQGRYNPILELAIKFSEFQKKKKHYFTQKKVVKISSKQYISNIFSHDDGPLQRDKPLSVFTTDTLRLSIWSE